MASYDYEGNGDAPETVAFAVDAADASAAPEMSNDEAGADRKEAALHADAGVHAALKILRRRLSDLHSPDGSRMNPAKTCQDIRRGHPHKNSGKRSPPVSV